jgi:hypothetical protein
MKVAGSKI